MLFNTSLFDTLLSSAEKNPRRRTNFDLRNSPDDTSQRMLNALLPGTQIPVHKHKDTSETLVVLKGRIKEVFYNNEGKITDEFVLNSNCIGLNIPKNQWHTIEVLEPSVILEMKDGQYKPLEQDDILTL